MIIRCEKCDSRFNIDERILKNGGSKVKCSVCKSVFTAFPSHEGRLVEETDEDDFALVDTAELDRLPPKRAPGPGSYDKEIEENFDKLFEDALEEGIQYVESPEPEDKQGLTERADEVSEADMITPRAAAGRRKKERSHVLLITLVIILVFIVGALIVFFLAPDILPDSLSALKPVNEEEITDTGTRRLKFKDVSGSFLMNNMAGKLYVIKGDVINDYPKSRSFILLKANILDVKGKSVKQKLSYAGNTFTEDQLMNFSMQEINNGLKNQAGKGDINVDIEPGGSVPFMIVFEELPDNLGEFEVEAVSSSPGE
jgi:predicted Zn finger-like uncharacterized protein